MPISTAFSRPIWMPRDFRKLLPAQDKQLRNAEMHQGFLSFLACRMPFLRRASTFALYHDSDIRASSLLRESSLLLQFSSPWSRLQSISLLRQSFLPLEFSASVGFFSMIIKNQPWCNSWWLTGLKAPTYWLTSRYWLHSLSSRLRASYSFSA